MMLCLGTFDWDPGTVVFSLNEKLAEPYMGETTVVSPWLVNRLIILQTIFPSLTFPIVSFTRDRVHAQGRPMIFEHCDLAGLKSRPTALA